MQDISKAKVMDAKELRIGNSVIDKDSKEEVILSGVDRFNCSFSSKTGGKFDCSKHENIEPIPLTEEKILEFGVDKEYFNEFDSICLLPIKWVHQFQNLYFARTGEELTIK